MHMDKYRNLNGNSGVSAYSISNDSITVKFVDGATYLYTVKSTGHENNNAMKAFAHAGRGLSTFIATHVRDQYAAKVS